MPNDASDRSRDPNQLLNTTDPRQQARKTVDELLLEEIGQGDDADLSDSSSPAELGEASESGSASSPDSDNDTLLNEQQVGLHIDEDEEHPQPVDIAAEVEKAERERRGLDVIDDNQ